jgi:bacterioferritin
MVDQFSGRENPAVAHYLVYRGAIGLSKGDASRPATHHKRPWGLISGHQARFLLDSAESIGVPRIRGSIPHFLEDVMANKPQAPVEARNLTRTELIGLLNEDLAREYQAIIAYVVYSQVLKGAQYMNIAGELELHAKQELAHAMTIAKQIDYLGGMPVVTAKPVKTSDKAEDMLRFDLDNENETIRNYRIRVRQCEALGEYALAEQIREILVQEQEHQIDLATALGVDVPDVTRPDERA